MILVTGATGYVGSNVVKKLAANNLAVRCLEHKSKIKTAKESFCIEVVEADIRDKLSLAVACNGIEVVVHLVAIIRETKEANFDDINVMGVRNMVNAAKENGVKHFIHISALGACDNPRFKYAYSKWLGEQEVINSGLDYTIIRPSVVFGPGGFGFIDRMLQAINMTPGIVAVPGDGRARFQPIYVKDVAECVLRIIKQPENYKGKVIEIGGPEHLTYEQMLDTLMKTIGIKKAKIHVPIPLVYIGALVMQNIMSDPPVTTIELAHLKLDNITDLKAVEREFGFKPIKYAEGIEYVKQKMNKS